MQESEPYFRGETQDGARSGQACVTQSALPPAYSSEVFFSPPVSLASRPSVSGIDVSRRVLLGCRMKRSDERSKCLVECVGLAGGHRDVGGSGLCGASRVFSREFQKQQAGSLQSD